MADSLAQLKTSVPRYLLSSTTSATFVPAPSPPPQANAASLPATAAPTTSMETCSQA
jgi:hypothetical protein